MSVGDRLPANVDPGDPLLRNIFPRPVTAVAFEVVGTFAVRDSAPRYWFDDRNLAEVAIGGTDDNPLAFATAVFAPEAYEDLLAARPAEPLPLEPVRRRRPARCRRRSTSLLPDLRRLDDRRSSRPARSDPGETLVRSGLLGLVESYLDQRATTEAALSVAALGPLAVAAGPSG